MSTMKYKGFARSSGKSQPQALRDIDSMAGGVPAECQCFEPGMEKIQVEQVLGAESAQRVLELDLFVPESKPDIEQVVDVYVKDLCIKSVDVIPDKVIVRGEFEVKVMYVADLPNEPVHAFEKHHIRWTRDIELLGAEKDMPATADVAVEYVDYDFHHHHNRRKVHVTIVLKVWARVTNTVEMDAYVVAAPTEPDSTSVGSASGVISASQGLTDNVSASSTGGGEIAGFGASNILVTGPMTPTAGMTTIPTGTGTVSANNVNVRTGPGTNFPSITKINKGTVVTIKEQAFGWYRVVLPDGSTTGWVASWLVETGVSTVPKG